MVFCAPNGYTDSHSYRDLYANADPDRYNHTNPDEHIRTYNYTHTNNNPNEYT